MSVGVLRDVRVERELKDMEPWRGTWWAREKRIMAWREVALLCWEVLVSFT